MGEWICEEVPGVSIDGKVLSTFLHKTKELVRCKDCKYYIEPTEEEAGGCLIKVGYFPVSENWFCADGEREEDDLSEE